MTDRERRAEELQKRRELLDRLRDDNNDDGGKPADLSPDWVMEGV